MKLLMVHNSYQQPGGEDVVFDQERHLLERAGHTVITYQRSNREVEAYNGLRRLELLGKTIWAKDTREEIAKLLDQEKPDLVHVHNTLVMISPSIFSVIHEAGIPVVQTLHNYRLYCPAATFFRKGHLCHECVDHSLLNGILHGCYRQSRAATAAVALMLSVHRRQATWEQAVTCFIALSEFSRQTFIKAGMAADKIFVKPNFVYPDPGPRLAGNGDYALFVGSLTPEKSVSTILLAWKRLASHVPLIIIGGGPQQQQLIRETVRLGLRGVNLKGARPREETLQAMRQARFLLFSSGCYENFPVTLAEGFACGLPVLCSRLGAMAEIVDDGRTGLQFSSGDPQDLAEKVEWAWNNPDRMRAMGEEARREYETKYTASQNYPLLMHIYEEAMRYSARRLQAT